MVAWEQGMQSSTKQDIPVYTHTHIQIHIYTYTYRISLDESLFLSVLFIWMKSMLWMPWAEVDWIWIPVHTVSCVSKSWKAKAKANVERRPAAVQSKYIRALQALVASSSPFRMLGTTLAVNVLLQGPYAFFFRSHPWSGFSARH